MAPGERARGKLTIGNHLVGIALGALGAIGVAVILVPFRSEIDNTNLALILVLVVGEAEMVEKQWANFAIAVPLEIVHAPSRDFTNATLHFVDELERRWENSIVTVLLPELFVEHWWEHLLHNQSALILKGRLLFRKNTAVTSIPYRADAQAVDG